MGAEADKEGWQPIWCAGYRPDPESKVTIPASLVITSTVVDLAYARVLDFLPAGWKHQYEPLRLAKTAPKSLQIVATLHYQIWNWREEKNGKIEERWDRLLRPVFAMKSGRTGVFDEYGLFAVYGGDSGLLLINDLGELVGITVGGSVDKREQIYTRVAGVETIESFLASTWK